MAAPFAVAPGLKRFPHDPKQLLQAWDSADELILKHLSENADTHLKNKRVLIVNDHFGALSCALDGFNSSTYTDSFVSYKAIQLNSQGRTQAFNSLPELSGVYDLVLIRIPKNMSFFEDVLCHLSGHLNSDSKIICGYMLKHEAKASYGLLSKYIGVTTTSLAQKKARLIFATFQRAPFLSPYPKAVTLDGFEIPFTHHSNLFSRERLDIGTRFLLSHIPQGDYKAILDLGCANGVVGIMAKQVNPAAKLIFSDESNMAIQSARANYKKYFPDQSDSAEFHWINCYEDQKSGAVDLVICNPPFHQGSTQGDHIAWQMFVDSRRALVAGGTLRVIGNTHLGYQATLKRLFGNSQVVAANQKFMIVDAVLNSVLTSALK